MAGSHSYPKQHTVWEEWPSAQSKGGGEVHIGVPLYACGGGTIPLLQQWLWNGMSVGSAASFILTGPATKITNLGAVKIVLGTKRFLLYLAYIVAFSLVTGMAVNLAV